ncbi:MAG: twin-arginine translocase TatA/TatE family subunit [Candidatus Eremiobacteraeota bacterium]|nr:twin-arginine translocase TatA/TatE family subunit [Candidatus Eremiobacteraeota bacterium]
MLGNLGLGEILIILVLILVLFGPKKIPELAGTVGRYINQFRRQMEEAQRSVIDPIRSDLNFTGGNHPIVGPSVPGTPEPVAAPVTPPVYVPVPLTEEEERARQPKRLLD